MNPIKQNSVFLLLGSNLGNRIIMLDLALVQISGRIGMIQRQSSVYESAPWGFEDKNNFLNKAIQVLTSLSPHELLKEIRLIEGLQGRVRVPGHYRSREIDIDILFFNDEIIRDEELVIPHTYLQDRRFVLVPLAEIAGNLLHPIIKQRVSELLRNCDDHSEVIRFNDHV